VCHGARDPAAARRFTPITRPSRLRRRPIVQRRLKGGGGDSPARCSGGRWPLRFPGRDPPVPPPAVLGVPLPAMLIVRRRQWGHIIDRERLRVRSVTPPAGDPTPITQVKLRTLAKSRVSIETWELRLSSLECDFPGINIPSLNDPQSILSNFLPI